MALDHDLMPTTGDCLAHLHPAEDTLWVLCLVALHVVVDVATWEYYIVQPNHASTAVLTAQPRACMGARLTDTRARLGAKKGVVERGSMTLGLAPVATAIESSVALASAAALRAAPNEVIWCLTEHGR